MTSALGPQQVHPSPRAGKLKPVFLCLQAAARILGFGETARSHNDHETGLKLTIKCMSCIPVSAAGPAVLCSYLPAPLISQAVTLCTYCCWCVNGCRDWRASWRLEHMRWDKFLSKSLLILAQSAWSISEFWEENITFCFSDSGWKWSTTVSCDHITGHHLIGCKGFHHVLVMSLWLWGLIQGIKFLPSPEQRSAVRHDSDQTSVSKSTAAEPSWLFIVHVYVCGESGHTIRNQLLTNLSPHSGS